MGQLLPVLRQILRRSQGRCGVIVVAAQVRGAMLRVHGIQIGPQRHQLRLPRLQQGDCAGLHAQIQEPQPLRPAKFPYNPGRLKFLKAALRPRVQLRGKALRRFHGPLHRLIHN